MKITENPTDLMVKIGSNSFYKSIGDKYFEKTISISDEASLCNEILISQYLSCKDNCKPYVHNYGVYYNNDKIKIIAKIEKESTNLVNFVYDLHRKGFIHNNICEERMIKFADEPQYFNIADLETVSLINKNPLSNKYYSKYRLPDDFYNFTNYLYIGDYFAIACILLKLKTNWNTEKNILNQQNILKSIIDDLKNYKTKSILKNLIISIIDFYYVLIETDNYIKGISPIFQFFYTSSINDMNNKLKNQQAIVNALIAELIVSNNL